MAGSVPDLKLYLLAVVAQGAEPEVNADGRHIILIELVIGESHQQAGLADARVSEQHHFEKVIVVLARSRGML